MIDDEDDGLTIEPDALLEQARDQIVAEQQRQRRVAQCRAHQVLDLAVVRVQDLRERARLGHAGRHRLSRPDDAAAAIRQDRAERPLAAPEVVHHRAHAVVHPRDAARLERLGAQRLDAGEESLRALLAQLEQLGHGLLARLRRERHVARRFRFEVRPQRRIRGRRQHGNDAEDEADERQHELNG